MMNITLYGINNCDTVKKALKWLNTHEIAHTFYDFKKQPLTTSMIQEFIQLSDLDQLINKRSTTYRNLSDEIKNTLNNEVAIEQAIKQPTLLKRPLLVIENNNQKSLYLGFKEANYQTILLTGTENV